MNKHFLRARFAPAWPLGEGGTAITGCEKHRALSRRAAGESMVLLKNNGVLPLQKGQKVALFGSAQVAYEQGGYEPSNTRFVKGTGEHIAEACVELLHKIHG